MTGYVRLNPTQYYRGATFFVCGVCVAELHELPSDIRSAHLEEMSVVAHAVFEAFQPRKMNYEALGNSVPHLHWWLTPRHHDDPRPRRPIWEDPGFARTRSTGSPPVSDDERNEARRTILDALMKRGATIERAFC